MAPSRKSISNPDTVTQPIKKYYANAVRVEAGPLLFISGQVSMDMDARVVAVGDLKGQAIQTLESIRLILEHHGAGMEDIVKVVVYVTDMKAFDEITEIRNKYFAANPPASTIIEISRLARPEWLIEIDAVAVLPH